MKVEPVVSPPGHIMDHCYAQPKASAALPLKPDKYKQRSHADKFKIITEGIDVEDVMYLKRSYKMMLNEGRNQANLAWINDTHWVDHPVTSIRPKRRRLAAEFTVPNRTGSARTEGCYEMDPRLKMRTKHHLHRSGVDVFNRIPAVLPAGKVEGAAAEEPEVLAGLEVLAKPEVLAGPGGDGPEAKGMERCCIRWQPDWVIPEIKDWAGEGKEQEDGDSEDDTDEEIRGWSHKPKLRRIVDSSDEMEDHDKEDREEERMNKLAEATETKETKETHFVRRKKMVEKWIILKKFGEEYPSDSGLGISETISGGSTTNYSQEASSNSSIDFIDEETGDKMGEEVSELELFSSDSET